MKHKYLSIALTVVLLAVIMTSGTLAFFTDSTEAGLNTIVTGNLDVELQFSRDGGQTWLDVESMDPILDANELLLPGDSDVALIRIVNNGSLALKYQLSAVNMGSVPGTSRLGNPIHLEDHLQVGAALAENGQQHTDYESQVVNGTAVGLDIGSRLYEGTLEAGESHVLDLAVWLPVTVGDEANYKPSSDPSNPHQYRPTIDVGIFLVATQASVEWDSFGPNYDQDAAYPEVNGSK